MSGHGPQFDQFSRQAGSPHGGATFDEGFGLSAKHASEAHGKLFDQFATRPGVDRYGDRFDEFGWQDMPTRHGRHFDEAFASSGSDTAHDNEHGHGTWFDAFRGGAEVRVMIDGADYEGTVIHCERSHAVVQTREGGRHEVDYGQIMRWRPANVSGQPKRDTKTGGMHKPATDTSVVGSAPKSPSLSANGGHLSDRVHAMPSESIVANKTDDDELDVEKAGKYTGPRGQGAADHPLISASQHAANRDARIAQASKGQPRVQHGGFTCKGCGHSDWRLHSVIDKTGKASKQIGMKGCISCGTMHPTRIGKTDDPTLDVAKDVDASETAAQAKDQEAPADGAGKAWCKACQHYCKKVQDGHCPTCGGPVSVRKTLADTLDLLKGLSA